MRIALEVFAQNGYLGTSMNDNAGQLGFTKAALYKYYSSKQEILDSIVERMNQMDVKRAKEYEMPDGDMEDVIADLKHSLIDPQGDFVTLTSVDNEAKTVVISDKELGEIKHMPKQIAKQLEEVQVFGIFRLYRVKENVLDGDNTLPQSGTKKSMKQIMMMSRK